MKATKKLLSMLLLAAMMMGLAVPASAAWMDEGTEVGRVTAEMMYNEPAVVEQEMTVGDDSAAPAVIEGTGASAAQAGQADAKVLVQKADGSQQSYGGIVDALAAASSGDVLTLNYDPSYGVTFAVDKSITILLNGHTIYVSVPGTSPALALSGVTLRGGSVVITASTVSVGPNDPPPTYVAGITGSGTLDRVHVYYTGPGRMMSGAFTVYAGSYSSDPSAYLPEGFEAFLDGDRYKIREAQPEEELTEEPEVTEVTEEDPEPVEAEEPVVEETGEVIGSEVEYVEIPEEEQPVAPAEEEPVVPTEEEPAEPVVPAEEELAEPVVPAEEEPVEPAVPSEGEPEGPIGGVPVILDENEEEIAPSGDEEAEEIPGEEGNEPPAEAEEETEAPAEEEHSDPSLIDRIVGLFETDDPDVDPDAQNIPHNSSKVGYASGATVTVSGAADEDELVVAAASGYEDALAVAAGDVHVVLALDISLSGERSDPVNVTVESELFKTLSDSCDVFHVSGGAAEAVLFSLDRENGVISFQTSDFSAFVIVEPDQMMIRTEDGEEDDMDIMERPIGNRYGNASGSMQYGMNQLEPNEGTIDMMANTNWDVTDWRTFTKVIINTRGYKICGADIVVPSGVELSIFGSGSGNFFDVDGRSIIVNGGTLVLTGTMKINGNITLNGGSLVVNGHSITVIGTTTINGGNVTIEGGKFGVFNASSGTGGISAGTFGTQVPAFLLSPGCVCTQSGNVWVVSGEAAVRTIDNSIKFTRGGGNYVEYYKGSTQNYNYQFHVTPVDNLNPTGSVTLVNSDGTVVGAPTYVYDDVKGLVTIYIQPNLSVMEGAPAGRCYFKFQFNNGAIVEVPINIYPSITYDPQVYYIDSFTPVVFTLSTNTFTGLDKPAYVTMDMKVGTDDPYTRLMTEGVHYSYNGNTVVIPASILNGLTPGMHVVDFWYDMEFGKVIQLSCKLPVYVDYKVTQINAVNLYKYGPMADVNWYQYSGRNLSFTANGDVSKFVGVRVDGRLISANNYMWASQGTGSTNVQLYPGYLAGLAQGKHTIEILFSDGIATADFSILSGSASPKTGDNNHIALWAGLLVLSGAAVVALIPKRRKQKGR